MVHVTDVAGTIGVFKRRWAGPLSKMVHSAWDTLIMAQWRTDTAKEKLDWYRGSKEEAGLCAIVDRLYAAEERAREAWRAADRTATQNAQRDKRRLMRASRAACGFGA